MTNNELCDHIWNSAYPKNKTAALFRYTHVCDEPENHDGEHVCHCGDKKERS